MNIFGWIIFGLMVLVTILGIANDKQSSGIRVFSTIINLAISVYILLTLI